MNLTIWRPIARLADSFQQCSALVILWIWHSRLPDSFGDWSDSVDHLNRLWFWFCSVVEVCRQDNLYDLLFARFKQYARLTLDARFEQDARFMLDARFTTESESKGVRLCQIRYFPDIHNRAFCQIAKLIVARFSQIHYQAPIYYISIYIYEYSLLERTL